MRPTCLLHAGHGVGQLREIARSLVLDLAAFALAAPRIDPAIKIGAAIQVYATHRAFVSLWRRVQPMGLIPLEETNTKSYTLFYKETESVMLEITYTRQATKTLRAMPPKTAKRILTAIEKLADNPARTDLDLKTLKAGGSTGQRWSPTLQYWRRTSTGTAPRTC